MKTKNNIPDAVNLSRKKDFSNIPNELIRSNEVSAKAFKVLCILLSNSKGWKSYFTSILGMMVEKESAIRSALKELESKGYLIRVRYRDPFTKALSGSLWVYADTPNNFDLSEVSDLVKSFGYEVDEATLRKATCRFSTCSSSSAKNTNNKKNNIKEDSNESSLSVSAKHDHKKSKRTSDTSSKYFKLAQKLSKIIQTKKNVTHTKTQLNQWAVEFKRLEKQNKVPIKRQKAVLKWYKYSIGGEFIPVVESGSSFRSKFTKLEDAIARETNSTKSKDNRTTGYRRKDGHKYKEHDSII